MLKDPSKTLCTECGSRGFKPSTSDENKIPSYNCLSCNAKIYSMEDLIQAEQTQKEQAATLEA